MTITVPKDFNGSPIPELTIIYNFKKYVVNAGESWKFEDDGAAKHLIDTFPFVKRMGDLKNIKTYVPTPFGNPNRLSPKYLGQEEEDKILDGGYPGIEEDHA